MPFLPLLLFAALLFPGLAQATSVINPVHGNAWDLYVFGNGRVIYDILMGVKMLMTPDAGTTGFTSLLLLMATLGFVCLAVAAGFDPAKNLMKMFGYIFTVWMVTLFSTSITANVNIHDLVVDKDGLAQEYTVSKVPALVALPAALTSEVGYYFTRVLETYFTLPTDFKMTDSSAGQFNLFSKMIEESNQYGFRYPDLKRSLSGYTADCVIPAMAMRKITTPVPAGITGGSGSSGGDYYGIEALMRSTNLLKTYEGAKHNAISTTYYPIMSPTYTANGGNFAAQAASTIGGLGVVMSCAEAYDQIVIDMNTSAKDLLNLGTEAWKKSGILVPFEVAMSSMLAQASASGSVGAGFSRPSGYIMQQGFLNSMTGAFRTAALQTGNSELLQAANLSQAEASQKSAWVAGFSTFNNMMGYVFTVLQAFIFSITPMIIVCLMIPGMGKGIFVNYAQILVWLTLWMPMLALINFIITLFGGEASAQVLSMDGGLSYNNKGLFVEKTKNIVIAAQFLGTMTPMITWGIVKGAMAFTEFINHGIGSSFANSAGAAAASGNLSMNNMSMDNTSMNKYNTALASTVGFQSTNTFASAGANLVSQSGGGSMADMNGGAVSASRALQQGISERHTQSIATSNALTWAKENATSASDALSRFNRGEAGGGTTEARAILENIVKQQQRSKNAGTDFSHGSVVDTGAAAAEQAAMQKAISTALEGSLGGGSPIPGFTASVVMKGSTGTQGTYNANWVKTAGQKETDGTGSKAAEAVSDATAAALARSIGLTTVSGSSMASGASRTHDEQASFKQSIGEALKTETAYQSSLEAMKSLAATSSINEGMTLSKATDLLNRMDAMKASSPDAETLAGRMSAMQQEVGGARADGLGNFDAATRKIRGSSVAPGGLAPVGNPREEIQRTRDGIEKDVGIRYGKAETVYNAARAAQEAREKANVMPTTAADAYARGGDKPSGRPRMRRNPAARYGR